MSSRELVLLGTASQVPTRQRNHNALFLIWDELGILFDPGEGTQRQMIHAGLAASQITHIAITHFHGDHCLGLAGIIQRLSLDRVEQPVTVIYPRSGQVFFERLRHASIYHDAAPLAPRPVSVAGGAGGEEIVIERAGKYRIVARPLDHGVDCFGYRLQEADGIRVLPERLEALGVRGRAVGELLKAGEMVLDGRKITVDEVSVRRPGQSFALVMDTRRCPGADALAQGADLLACESTYLESESREAWERHHMTARSAGELARDAAVRRLVLTHFSQRYPMTAPFAAEAGRFHGDVVVGEDLRRIAVPARQP